ncbi:MAG: heme NO-binding protein [Gammaproteobacteria bacterium]|nr:heme NO-binding protein [Gammaproteobacteria bacterium]
MYGMINRGLQEMVLAHHGETVWQSICEKAGAKDTIFVRMDTYPDSLTYNMVGAARAVLGAPVEELMRGFGKFWISYASKEGYGPLLDEAGDTLFEMLENLDDLHFRLGHVFPLYGTQKGFDKMMPPQFTVTDKTANRVLVHYRSKRDGLAPMVVGLIEGLAEHCGATVKVTQVAPKSAGADHDSLEVEIL